jgi:hypothetical protein
LQGLLGTPERLDARRRALSGQACGKLLVYEFGALLLTELARGLQAKQRLKEARARANARPSTNSARALTPISDKEDPTTT